MSLITNHTDISISALKEGDRDAFRQLVNAYKDAVVNICYGFLHNAADAEDLAQDVFVEVYQSLHKFREDSSLYTWIYKIATSKSLDELRKRSRLKRKAFESAKQAVVDEDDNPLERVEGEWGNPEQDLIQKQQAEAIASALEKIPETQRIAFTLFNYQSLSYREISEVMEKSEGSVESLIHRAKANLRKELEAFYQSQFGT